MCSAAGGYFKSKTMKVIKHISKAFHSVFTLYETLSILTKIVSISVKEGATMKIKGCKVKLNFSSHFLFFLYPPLCHQQSEII